MVINLNIFNGKSGGGLSPEQEEKLNNAVELDKYNEDKEVQITIDDSQNRSIQNIRTSMVTSVNGEKGKVNVFITWEGTKGDYDNIQVKDKNIFYCIKPETPFAITALENGTIALHKKISSTPTLNLEYSLDRKTWNVFSQGTSYSINTGETIYIRGINDRLAVVATNYNYFYFSNKVELSGNIMSLLYGDDYENQDVIKKDYCFAGLFFNCKTIESIENLKLPATTLKDYCYYQMFSGCTGLETIPKRLLPATTLTTLCYQYMFNGCTNLKNTCIIPASETRNINSCQSMFAGCTSLVETEPILIKYPYGMLNYMFNGCTNLKSVTVGFESISSSTGSISQYWLRNVAEGGNINIPSTATWDTTLSRSADGVPASWTITKI